MSWLESLGLLGLFLGTFLAATIVPFSSDALYVAVLMATHNPIGCLVVGTLGNWLGSVTTYWIGRIGRWEWIERWFKVSPEAMERQKKKVDRYGIWLALLAWVPFIGDVFTLALGFFKTKPVGTILCSLSASSSVSSFGTLLLGRCSFGKELNAFICGHRCPPPYLSTLARHGCWGHTQNSLTELIRSIRKVSEKFGSFRLEK